MLLTATRPNLDIIENKLIPEIQSYKPDLIIISTGFDAHADDPLGQMRVLGRLW